MQSGRASLIEGIERFGELDARALAQDEKEALDELLADGTLCIRPGNRVRFSARSSARHWNGETI